MKNILIIGNGFDKAHGLKTGYKDFVDFCECIKDYLNEENCIENDVINYERIKSTFNTLEKIMINKNIHTSIKNKFMVFLIKKAEEDEVERYLLGCHENYWLQYIYENKENLGDRWCDLEFLIGEKIEAHAIVMSHPEETAEKYINKKNFDQINTIIAEMGISEGDTYYSQLKNLLNNMFNALQDLIWMLELYLDRFLNDSSIKNELFQIIPADHILSFNYTSTYQKLYGSNADVHYIHGFTNSKRAIEENNMVFGIGQEIRNSSEYEEIEYVMFQKYYQRIVKKTGNKYKQWLQKMDTMNVFIFGHSLDVPDGDIIRDFVNHEKSIVYIFYNSQKALNNIVINLINIFQKDQLISLTNENKINFLEVDEIDKVQKALNRKESDWIY